VELYTSLTWGFKSSIIRRWIQADFAHYGFRTHAPHRLKAMLDNPDLVLLDVRTGKDWTGSEEKIKGALREDPGKLDEWADKFDKGKTVVLYCA
jgi:rhodanese-related sulfurtransferase